jgi:hypothetical protein
MIEHAIELYAPLVKTLRNVSGANVSVVVGSADTGMGVMAVGRDDSSAEFPSVFPLIVEAAAKINR